MFQESIRSTQWEIQHQKQHVKQHVKHWFFATVVAGAGKGNFQLPDTAAVSAFLPCLPFFLEFKLGYLAGSLCTTVCLYVACMPMAMSVLGLNFEVPAASFTSKFF